MWLASFILLSFASAIIAQVHVDVRAQSELVNDRYFVMDIASCEGDAVLCSEVGAVYLGSSPVPGESVTLTAEQLKNVVKIEHGSVELRVPEKVQLTRASIDIPRSEIVAVVESRIRSWVKPLADQLRIQQLRFGFVKSLRIPKMDYQLQVREEWDQRLIYQLGRQRFFNVDIISEQRTIATTKVSVSAQIEINTLVARKAIAAGVAIQHEDCEYHWLPLQRAALTEPLVIQQVVGKSLKSPLGAGQIVRSGLLTSPLAVQRGDTVKLRVLTSGGMQLDGEAKALASGGIGQPIKVIYAKTKKTIQATIVEPGLVEVRL
jgi:flagella basal body P-ring formation protein FlgA